MTYTDPTLVDAERQNQKKVGSKPSEQSEQVVLYFPALAKRAWSARLGMTRLGPSYTELRFPGSDPSQAGGSALLGPYQAKRAEDWAQLVQLVQLGTVLASDQTSDRSLG